MHVHVKPVGTRLVALLAVVPLAAAFAPPAYAAQGESTPGVTVIASNPGVRSDTSDLGIALTAHTETSTLDSPSCRPEDLTLRCWGSLTLRVPELGMRVTQLQVHRVVVGDIACGEDGGCADGEGDGIVPTAAGEPLQAQVNGLAVLQAPGNSGYSAGTQVQVKITLTDNGSAPYADQAEVTINAFISDDDKPQIYHSPPAPVQQVQIHYVGGRH